MRAVVDIHVIIAALLSPTGSPALTLREWLEGRYELVASPLLLAGLQRALAYPKLRDRIAETEVDELVELLRSGADLQDDPVDPPPVRSSDPDDDDLIALAATSRAVIVSGDRHLLDLADELPVYSPAAFLELLDESPA